MKKDRGYIMGWKHGYKAELLVMVTQIDLDCNMSSNVYVAQLPVLEFESIFIWQIW